MPINKVPVINRFGIISERQRLEITERLCRKSVLENNIIRKPFFANRNPLEVTEEFIDEYNEATTELEQKKYQTMALKILARIKRRVGLNVSGIGKHVNLPVAWTELAQLLECRGPIQDDCLDCLLLSLGQAPISQTQVTALFFLAESLLYLLRTETLQQPFLKRTELKLLKVCQVLFTRLYFHKMANHLQGCHHFKNRLSCYIQGLAECQSLYASYPDALLYLRFMIQVSSIILNNFQMDSGENNETDDANVTCQPPNEKKDSSKTLQGCASRESNSGEMRCPSTHTSWMSSSIHELSPSLWHSLDVWKCQNLVNMKSLSDKFKNEYFYIKSLKSLMECSSTPDNESCWIDCVIAVSILAEAAKTSLTTLKILQTLACHCINRYQGVFNPQTRLPKNPTEPELFQEEGETKQQTKHQETQPNFSQSKDEALLKEKDEQTPKDLNSNEETTSKSTNKKESSKISFLSNLSSSDAMAFDPPYDEIDSSFHHWHWDVTFTYSCLLGDIVLYGKTSLIQKRALLGANKDISCTSFLAGVHQCPEECFNKKLFNDNEDCDDPLQCYVGLFDLAFYQTTLDIPNEAADKRSWKIRFGAIQALIRIYENLSNDPSREGLQMAAWGILYMVNATERDPRVLEAIRVGHIQSNQELLTKTKPDQLPNHLPIHLANGLVRIYLNYPNPNPPQLAQLAQIQGGFRYKSAKVEAPKRTKEKPFKKHRTSIREEILFRSTWHVNPLTYNARTTFRLRKLVEEQWRKDLIGRAVKEKKFYSEDGLPSVFKKLDNSDRLIVKPSSGLDTRPQRAAKETKNLQSQPKKEK